MARPVPPPAPIMMHSKIAQIDRELAADGAQESFAISIRSDQFLIANTNRVYGSCATCGFIRLIDLPEARDFVRHRQVHSYEVEISQKRRADLNSFGRI